MQPLSCHTKQQSNCPSWAVLCQELLSLWHLVKAHLQEWEMSIHILTHLSHQFNYFTSPTESQTEMNAHTALDQDYNLPKKTFQRETGERQEYKRKPCMKMAYMRWVQEKPSPGVQKKPVLDPRMKQITSSEAQDPQAAKRHSLEMAQLGAGPAPGHKANISWFLTCSLFTENWPSKLLEQQGDTVGVSWHSLNYKSRNNLCLRRIGHHQHAKIELPINNGHTNQQLCRVRPATD